MVTIPVAKWKFDSLTEEEAFDLACHENIIQVYTFFSFFLHMHNICIFKFYFNLMKLEHLRFSKNYQ